MLFVCLFFLQLRLCSFMCGDEWFTSVGSQHGQRACFSQVLRTTPVLDLCSGLKGRDQTICNSVAIQFGDWSQDKDPVTAMSWKACGACKYHLRHIYKPLSRHTYTILFDDTYALAALSLPFRNALFTFQHYTRAGQRLCVCASVCV